SKDDWTNGAANYSIFNLSEDLIHQVNPKIIWKSLNSSENLTGVVAIIDAAIERWGVPAMLDFVRGGRDAFNDHSSWGAPSYRRVIATSIVQISQSPELMSDNRRPMLRLDHV